MAKGQRTFRVELRVPRILNLVNKTIEVTCILKGQFRGHSYAQRSHDSPGVKMATFGC